MPARLASYLLMPLVVAAVTLCFAVGTQAQTETILYSFALGANGYNPVAGLVLDSSGTLFGTTSEGGTSTNCSVGCGVVFGLSQSGGIWTETVSYEFNGGKRDGASSFAGVISDSAGTLYGTTGNGASSSPPGNGVVFKLSPNGTGGWTESILHVFTGGIDGANPYGGLILDSAGNLYGTAHGGGSAQCGGGCGTVFELSPTTKGLWKITLLHEFTGGLDGEHPSANLTFDSAGNLFGTASQGGAHGSGVVFRLSLSGGHWQERVLYSFTDNFDGGFPAAGVVFDSAGNLYTTTTAGGDLTHCGGAGCGGVFQFSPTAKGPWKETALYTFKQGADGAIPSGVIFDSAGNLYGTTVEGGNTTLCNINGCGVAFELSSASGAWTETVLHTFDSVAQPGDGLEPQAGVILDSGGHIYGTTQYGGANGVGAVFEITK